MIKDDNGFTLIELIIVIVIVGIIGSLIGILILQGVDSYSFVSIQKDNIQTGRLAMERMGREIRESTTISFNPSSPSEDITINGSIRFYKSGRDLFRNQGGSNDLLASNVDSLRFTDVNLDQRLIAIDLGILKSGESRILRNTVFRRATSSKFSGWKEG